MAGPALTLDLRAEAVNVPVAAYAAGVSPRTFRNWLESGALPLLVPRRGAGKWLRCAPVDAVRLATLGHLVAHGYTIAEAASIVREIVDRRLEGIVAVGGDAPWFLLTGALRGMALNVSREAAGLTVTLSPAAATRPTRHTAATLTINLGFVAEIARQRVREKVGAE